jgi:hypothetical protein
MGPCSSVGSVRAASSASIHGRGRRRYSSRRAQPADGLRPLGRKSFLLVEGAGTLDRVEVDGDRFQVTPLRAGFHTPTSVTRVASVVWVSEGQMPLFFDPALKGQSPALPFRIYAVRLRKEDTR